MKSLIVFWIYLFILGLIGCAATQQTQQPDPRLYLALLDQIDQQKKEIDFLTKKSAKLTAENQNLSKLGMFAINSDSTRVVLNKAKTLGLLRQQRPEPTIKEKANE